ncbi:arylsulfatase [Microbacterium sediminicola]|uniref:Arylsulfatase n=1 Tax=Microbacterium sediminicola TaxID=415210 RepID=A0ABP4UIF6_9MICO
MTDTPVTDTRATDAPRPNVLVILADDLGYSDLGSYGGEIPTPNLDRLAARGVRMSSFYANPKCSPTRASLMTGRYSHEVGIGVLTRPLGYRGSLDVDVPTIANVLHDQGYFTSITGKWHLSSDVSAPNETWPTRRGFEDFFGIVTGGTSYFNPQAFYRGEEPVQVDAADDAFYLTHAFTEHAQEVIASAAGQDRPFFLYLAYTAPHWPLQAPAADIAAQQGRYAGGWDQARIAREQRQADLGLFPRPFEPAPRDAEEPSWADAENSEWQQRRMEVYAAQVGVMDRGIGQILGQLEAAGTLDDTLILFLSDNGAEAAEFRPGQTFNPLVTPETTRGGEQSAMGNRPEVMPGAESTFQSYGRPWANLSNTPFRFYKSWVHEGGIATPLIASWPAGGLDGGGIIHEPGHVIDLMPTIAAATGAQRPDVFAGADLLGALRGRGLDERDICWEHIGNGAIRRGDWKLVCENERDWELYDMSVDRAEQNDLAASHPDLVAELSTAWKTWADSHGVIPFDELQRMFVERGLPAWQAKS